METAERRRSEDREQSKRLFEYERAIVMAVGAIVMAATAWNANKTIELGVAMESKASRDAVVELARSNAFAMGNLAAGVDGLKLSFSFEKESVDRRLTVLERELEARRNNQRREFPPQQ